MHILVTEIFDYSIPPLFWDDSEINDAIKELKMSKSVGSDNLPACIIIKGCLDIFRTSLLFLFNISIKISVFPTKWKAAKVIPVF